MRNTSRSPWSPATRPDRTAGSEAFQGLAAIRPHRKRVPVGPDPCNGTGNRMRRNRTRNREEVDAEQGTAGPACGVRRGVRSEEHTSELQSLMRISYAVFCLKKKNKTNTKNTTQHNRTLTYIPNTTQA